MENKISDLIQVPGGKVAANALCRLGNQMFIAAAARTYGARSGREFVGLTKTNNKSDYPEDIMNTVMRNVRWINPDEIKDFYHLPHGEWLCNGFPNTDIKDIYFDDFFQDARCIDRGIAFDLFKPYEAILRIINELYGDLRDYVCMNVRRGDYLFNKDFNVFTQSELLSIINTYFPNDKVLFMSDDIQWCKDNFIGSRYSFADKYYPCKPEIDLYIQTQCKSNIISNSTFSWWGAYLNEKSEKVVCPWPWFRNGVFGCEIIVLDDKEDVSDAEELTRDLMALLARFQRLIL